MNDRYLWDGTGEVDPDVAHFERWAGTLGYAPRSHRPRPAALGRDDDSRRWLGYGIGLGLGAAAALLLVWLGGPRTAARPAATTTPMAAPAVQADAAGAARSRVVTPPPAAGSRVVTPPLGSSQAAPPVLPSAPEPEAGRAPRPRSAPPALPRSSSPSGASSGSSSSAAASPAAADELDTQDELSEEQRRAEQTRGEAQLKAHAEQLDRCFRTHAPKAPRGALIILKYTIDRDGSIRSPRLRRHNLPSPSQGYAVAQCLAKVIKTWRMSPRDPPLETYAMMLSPGPR